MDCDTLEFSRHALMKMFARGIMVDEVRLIVALGEIISDYPDDKPLPSVLLLGFIDNKPLYVVLARDIQNQHGIVVTAYVPDTALWQADFKTRKSL